MTADEAFANLMDKNALDIPVAEARDAAGRPPARPIAAGRGATEARPAPAGDDILRVSELLDEEPADYLPRGDEAAGGHERGGAYNYPTETDLGPAARDADDMRSARLHGARILGRDAGNDDGAPVPDDGGPPDAEYANGEDTRVDERAAAEIVNDFSGTHLGRARRLRRFAYLPLSGMDAFETSARDMLASLTAFAPDRPSLAITSAARGEGRTELAIRLALAAAKRVGYRVLLADFDMRKPRVAARLGLSSKYFTLADVLRGSCPLGEALVVSEEDNLYVLPARASDRDGDEVLDSRQVESLLAEMHHAFAFTIFDCGPVGHADAMILCRLAGATALAGFCGVSSAARLNEAGEKLEAAGARLAGAILTGA